MGLVPFVSSRWSAKTAVILPNSSEVKLFCIAAFLYLSAASSVRGLTVVCISTINASFCLIGIDESLYPLSSNHFKILSVLFKSVPGRALRIAVPATDLTGPPTIPGSKATALNSHTCLPVVTSRISYTYRNSPNP